QSAGSSPAIAISSTDLRTSLHPSANSYLSAPSACGRKRSLVRHDDATPFRGEPRQKRRARNHVMPKISPARTVAINGHPALARICAARRAVHDRVHKQERIARLEMHFYRASDAIHRALLVALVERDGLRV